MKFEIIRVTMALLWILAACKWGDLKNWRRYYPTMLFFGFGDLIYHAVFAHRLLWSFSTDFLVPPLNELLVIFGIFFPTVLLFLTNYPQKLHHEIIYIIFWVAVYMAIEIFTTSIGMEKIHNGWSLWWSLLHNSIQFPLVALHHKKPVLAWIIALAFLFIIMHAFNVPFTIHT